MQGGSRPDRCSHLTGHGEEVNVSLSEDSEKPAMRIRANVIATAFALAALAALSIFQSACGGAGYGGGNPPPTAPSITTQPQSTTVTAGLTATFSVAATGTAPLSYQWQRNNANINGATQASYTTPATTTADNNATFLVTVSNSVGSINSNSATLTVNSSGGGGNAPTMTIQPQNQILNAGQTATFTAAATGTGALTYQWFVGTTAINGATAASYTTPALSLTNNGNSYYVAITDTNGTTTSATASATVLNPAAPINVLTYHNDVARTGQNLNETTLKTTNVNASTFGKVGFMTVTGLVDAEPLYVSGLSVNGGTHNVVFVATENDLVYAFDADNFAQLWGPVSVTAGDTYSDNRGCDQVTPNIGVTSTPVIDLSAGPHGTMFLVAMTKDNGGNYHHKLHALDITTGAEMAGSPVEITATFTIGATHTTFTPSQYKERAALLLLNGQIYLGFSSHCDATPYQGWMMAYSESSLQQTAVLNVTPNGNEGAIWMAGDGLAADSSGNIFFLDANGSFDTTLNASGFPNESDFGNAFIKVSTAGNSLAVADYFNMKGTVHESDTDEDLGSGGDLLLPDMNDLPGNARHLAVGAGKDSIIYVVDRDSMGKFSPTQDSIYQEVTSNGISGGVWSMPAYFNDTVYYASVGDALKAFSIVNGLLVAPPGSQSSATYAYPGGIPSVSANGNTNGIVWVVQNGNGGVLYAYDATNLSNELYNSTQGSGGSFADNKFITPMIANGKVYVGTPTGVIVFGLK